MVVDTAIFAICRHNLKILDVVEIVDVSGNNPPYVTLKFWKTRCVSRTSYFVCNTKKTRTLEGIRNVASWGVGYLYQAEILVD